MRIIEHGTVGCAGKDQHSVALWKEHSQQDQREEVSWGALASVHMRGDGNLVEGSEVAADTGRWTRERYSAVESNNCDCKGAKVSGL